MKFTQHKCTYSIQNGFAIAYTRTQTRTQARTISSVSRTRYRVIVYEKKKTKRTTPAVATTYRRGWEGGGY